MPISLGNLIVLSSCSSFTDNPCLVDFIIMNLWTFKFNLIILLRLIYMVVFVNRAYFPDVRKKKIHREVCSQDGVAAGVAELWVTFVRVNSLARLPLVVILPERPWAVVQVLQACHYKHLEHECNEEKLSFGTLVVLKGTIEHH